MKKRTGKMISLSLAVAMAMTAAPVTAMADEPVKTDVIEAPALTSADQTEETTTEEGTAWAELTPAEKTEEEEVLSDEGTETTEGITTVEELKPAQKKMFSTLTKHKETDMLHCPML